MAAFIAHPEQQLAELLLEPSPAYSPVPIWWWSGDVLNVERLVWQLDRLKEGGVHQAVVLNLAPTAPTYGSIADEPTFGSSAWWSIFRHICAHAHDRNFRLWFYDQLGFSGADIQGRLIQQDPELRGRRLGRGPVLPDGAEILHRVGSGSRSEIIYSEPWGYDYLNPVAAAALLDTVHGEFERQVGEFLGTTIVGSFQDELPSLPNWSSNFLEQFTERRGYDLTPHLDELWEQGHSRSSQVRADYQRTRAELAESAFFEPLGRWHSERGLVVGCDQQHPARAGYPVETTQQYGDYLRTHRWFSAPGSDHWGDAKIHSSLAHLYGHPRTWIEAFHTTGWGGTVEETFDWLIPWLRAGATLYNPHAVYYSTRATTWEWAAPSTCWRQPYWRHYRLFANAVAQLTSALNWGHHVCDIAVLHPGASTRAQIGLGHDEQLFGTTAGQSLAQDLYLDTVGRMHWYQPQPGALDLDGRDFDILDDESLASASAVEQDSFQIAHETYRALILPGCSTLEPATARTIEYLSSANVPVICIGVLPEGLSERCNAALHVIADPSELPAALATIPRSIASTTPALLRSDGRSWTALLTAAHGALTQPAAEQGWREHGYSFDPKNYQRNVAVRITDAHGPACLWEPDGTITELHPEPDGDALNVSATIANGPCALLLLGEQAQRLLDETHPREHQELRATTVIDPNMWRAASVNTLNNEWQDHFLPGYEEGGTHQIWQFSDVKASFGVRAFASPVAAASSPHPTLTRHDIDQLSDAMVCPPSWRTLEYSELLGVDLGPEARELQGYIPEEFLDLGHLKPDESINVRVLLRSEQAPNLYFTVGAATHITIWCNGEQLSAEPGYYLSTPIGLEEGLNLVEIRLTAIEEVHARASWWLSTQKPEPRPQWIGAHTSSTHAILAHHLPAAHFARIKAQLATTGPVRLRVNGELLATHGEFDNYAHLRQPRVRRYDLTAHLQTDSILELELPQDASVALDIVGYDNADQSTILLTTGQTWRGSEAARIVPRQVAYDPRWLQLSPRTHVLPAGTRDTTNASAPLAAVHAVSTCQPGITQVFVTNLPPGTRRMRLPVRGAIRSVAVDDVNVSAGEGGWFSLEPASRGGARCEITVDAPPGLIGGAVWSGPLELWAPDEASMPLGDWNDTGLHGFSGAVTYRQSIDVPEPARLGAVLDLGEVRGTAEVSVDGVVVGARAWSPYRFELPPLEATACFEVTVFNTLAPHVDAASTSPWVLPGQVRSGLFGPVVLHHDEVNQ